MPVQSEGEMIAIRRLTQVPQHDTSVKVVPELIARIRFQTGVYDTAEGKLALTVCKPNKDNQIKCIFEGDVIPTIQERGKKAQFHRESGKRRVVVFSPRHQKPTLHDNGPDVRLEFKREEQKMHDVFLAAD